MTITALRVRRSRPLQAALLAAFGVGAFVLGGIAGRALPEGGAPAVVVAAPARAEATDRAAPSPVVEPEGSAAPPAAGAGARPPTPPPFPGELAEMVTRVDGGRVLTSRQERTVRTYHRDHPEDSGAAIVMARSYFNRRYFADALAWYERAFERDPRARNHDGALYELVRIARVDRSEREARALIAHVYGAAAIPAVDAALAEEQGVEDRAALVRLRQHLASL